MSVIKKARQIETFEISEPKIDLSILRKKSTGKTASGICLGYMRKLKNSGASLEFLKVLESMYKDIFNLETSEKVRFESWRGKGGIKIWNTPDKIIVEFAGKRDKNEKPKITRKSYLKQEINRMIICINKLKDEFNNKIPSRKLGEEYFKGNWDLKVFSKRPEHIKFTHLLNILDYYKIIHYNRNGITSVLRHVKEIQEVLK